MEERYGMRENAHWKHTCECKECQDIAWKRTRNAFYKDLGVGTIGDQRSAAVEFYLRWFSTEEHPFYCECEECI